jgi:hypothetical protein
MNRPVVRIPAPQRSPGLAPPAITSHHKPSQIGSTPVARESLSIDDPVDIVEKQLRSLRTPCLR